MKRIKIAAQNSNRGVTISIPGLGKGLRKAQRFLEINDYALKALFYVMILALPLTPFLLRSQSNSVGYESSSFLSVLILMLLAGSLFLVGILWNGIGRVIDPKGMFVVLLFALLTTTATVVITPTNAANTFGSIGINSIKGLSGLAVILYLAVFYLTNIIFSKKAFVNRALNILTLGFVGFVLYIWTNELIGALPFLAVLAAIVFAWFGIKRRFGFLLTVPALAVLTKLAIDAEFNDLTVFGILFTLFIASLPITFVFFSYLDTYTLGKIKILRSRIDIVIKGVQGKGKLKLNDVLELIISLVKHLAIVVTPIITFALLILIINNDSVLNIFENAKGNIDGAFSTIQDNAKGLIFGLGTSKTSAILTLLGSIIQGQGIIGLVSYIMLFVFGIYKALVTLKNSIGRHVINLALITLVIIWIPVLSLFAYPGFVLLAIWWLFFGILMSIQKPNEGETKKRMNLTKILPMPGFKGSNVRNGLILKLLISLTLVVISFILIYTILDVTGSLI